MIYLKNKYTTENRNGNERCGTIFDVRPIQQLEVRAANTHEKLAIIVYVQLSPVIHSVV